MAFKYSPSNLQKVESLFKQLHYVVRYEKGNFQSGYCIVKEKKVIVINKFYTVEARLNVLLDILKDVQTSAALDDLDDEHRSFYEALPLSVEK